MSRRLIEVKNNTFEYVVGRCYVAIWAPNGDARIVSIPDLKGTTWEIFERGQWKKTSDGMVTPSEVAHFIECRTTGQNLEPL